MKNISRSSLLAAAVVLSIPCSSAPVRAGARRELAELGKQVGARSGDLVPAVPAARRVPSSPIPTGSFKGSSPLTKGPDIMVFLVRQDPKDASAYYAVLAEYRRKSGVPLPERTKLTIWVNRMYAYRLEAASATSYIAKPLAVTSKGEIDVDGSAQAATLNLAKAGSMEGATFTRDNEAILFNGRVSSTWEDLVPGKYFQTKNDTGDDYFKKNVNMVVGPDGAADFNTPYIVGKFALEEKAPGMFTFSPRSTGNKGETELVGRIGVFVDIVNWKPLFTTDELLVINPSDAKDVGFYYERH